MKYGINIQSISDLITNSSTEAFVVYDKGNIEDIKNLVDSILSLLDPSKTFDDYFTIEMLINYDDLHWIFERYYEDEDLYEGFIVNVKDENDPVVKRVATAINHVDNIFDVDYSSNY